MSHHEEPLADWERDLLEGEDPSRETTVRHRIGICPACQCGVYADVTLRAELQRPYLAPMSAGSAPLACVNAYAEAIAAIIEHRCQVADDPSQR